MNNPGPFLYLTFVLFCCERPVECTAQEISFAEEPVDLYCSEAPIRSIAFRANNGTDHLDLVVCAGIDSASVTVMEYVDPGTFNVAAQFPVGPFGNSGFTSVQDVYCLTFDPENNGNEYVIIYWNRDNTTIPEQFIKIKNVNNTYEYSLIGTNLSKTNGFYRYDVHPQLFDANDDNIMDIIFEGRLYYLFNQTNQSILNKVLLGNSNGEFIDTNTAIPETYFLRHADVNGDGTEELFRITSNNLTEVLVRQDATNFTPVDSIASLLSSPVRTADVTGDGTPDLLLNWSTTAGFPFRPSAIPTDNGWLAEPVLLYEAPAGFETRASFQDFDLDGNIDMLLWSGTNQPNGQSYSVQNGTGELPFTQQPVPILLCDQREHLIEDVDSDGDPDLVIYDRHCVQWLQNNTLTTSIDDGFRMSMTSWPNPANDMFTIRTSYTTEKMSVQVRNATGAHLLSGLLESPLDRVDVSGLESGSYVISIHDASGARLASEQLIICR